MADEIIEMTPEEFAAQFGGATSAAPATLAATAEPEVIEMTPEEFAVISNPKSKLGEFGRGMLLGAGKAGTALLDIGEMVMNAMPGRAYDFATQSPFKRTREGQWQQLQQQAVGLPDYTVFESPRLARVAAEGLGGAAVTAPLSGATLVGQGLNVASSLGGEAGQEVAQTLGIDPAVGSFVGVLTPTALAKAVQAGKNLITQQGAIKKAGQAISGMLGDDAVAALQKASPEDLAQARTLAEALPGSRQAAMYEDAIKSVPEVGAPLISVEQQIADDLAKAATRPIGGNVPIPADEAGLAMAKEAAKERAALEAAARGSWQAVEKTGQQLDLTPAIYSLSNDLKKTQGVEAMSQAQMILNSVSGKGNLSITRTADGRILGSLDDLQKLRSFAGEKAAAMPKTAEAKVLRRFVGTLDEALEQQAGEFGNIAPANVEAYKTAIAKTRDLKTKFKGTWIEDLASGDIDEKLAVRKLLQKKQNAEVYVKAFKENPEMMALAKNAVAEQITTSSNPLKTWRNTRLAAKQILEPEHFDNLEKAVVAASRRSQVAARVRAGSPGMSVTAPRQSVIKHLKDALETPPSLRDALQNSVLTGVGAMPFGTTNQMIATGAALAWNLGRRAASGNKRVLANLLAKAAVDPNLARELTKNVSRDALFSTLEKIGLVGKVTTGLNARPEIEATGGARPSLIQDVQQPKPQPLPSRENKKIELSSLIENQPAIVRAVIAQESDGKQSAISSKGARGLMQVMPIHGERLGLDLSDPEQNIAAGRAVLREELGRYQSLPLALAAYNAGAPAVERAIKKAGTRSWVAIKKHLPEETKKYVPMVLARLKKLEKQG